MHRHDNQQDYHLIKDIERRNPNQRVVPGEL